MLLLVRKMYKPVTGKKQVLTLFKERDGNVYMPVTGLHHYDV